MHWVCVISAGATFVVGVIVGMSYAGTKYRKELEEFINETKEKIESLIERAK